MPRIYRATLSCTLMGSVCQNVLHFLDSADAISLEQAAQDLRDGWLEHVRNAQFNQCTWFNINVANISAVPLPNSFNLTISKTGVIGEGVTMAPFAATLFTIRTDFGGRKGRGRFYLPGVGQTFFVNGVMSAGTLTHINNNVITPLEAKYLPGGTSALDLGIMTRGDTASFKVARNIEARATMGAQRRRNIGVGM